MQTVTSTLATAITSNQRHIFPKVSIDWGRNLLTPNQASVETSVADWTYHSAGSGSTVQSTDHAHKGTKSAKVTWPNNDPSFNDNVLTTALGLTLGHTYTLSGWAWVPGAQPRVYLTVWFVNNTAPGNHTDMWDWFSVEFTASNVNQLVGWSHYDAAVGASANFYFDDMRLEDTTGGPTGAGSTYIDLSAYVESVTIRRSITSDLPAEANIVQGIAAGEASVSLGPGPDPAMPLTKVLSPYTARLGPNGHRLGATVEVQAGLYTTAGPETVPAFVGRTRTVDLSDEGSTEVAALDGAEVMRTAVTLPPVVGSWPGSISLQPGLNSQFAIDYILRANGYYAAPPPRANLKLATGFHGSGWTSDGWLASAFQYQFGGYLPTPITGLTTLAYREVGSVTGSRGRLPFAPQNSGLLGLAINVDGDRPDHLYSGWYQANPYPGITYNDGGDVFVEFIARSGGAGGSMAMRLQETPTGTGSWAALWEFVFPQGTQVTNGWPTIACSAIRNGAGTAGGDTFFDFNALNHSTADLYVGIHFHFTATGVTYHVSINGSEQTASDTVGNASGCPAIDEFILVYNETSAASARLTSATTCTLSSLQITTEAYSSGMYNHNFAPNAILEPSLNNLIAMPATENAAPWALLNEIASAENGVILLDEAGNARFYNRDHMSGGNTAVGTLSPTRQVKSVAVQEQVDTVKNMVSVPSAPPALDTNYTFIWQASEVLSIQPGATLTVNASWDGMAFMIDPDGFSYYSVSSTVPWVDGSGYRASATTDGAGGDVSNLVISEQRLPGRDILTISNPNNFPVYLVENSLAGSTRGQPCLHIAGFLARIPTAPYKALAMDATSRATYGDQSLDVPDNRFRQTNDQADELAKGLLARLKDTHPVLAGVPVVGDPRYQLGDRLTLSELADLELVRDYWLVAKETTLSEGGLAGAYTLREAGWATTGMLANWKIGDPIYGQLDSTNGIA